MNEPTPEQMNDLVAYFFDLFQIPNPDRQERMKNIAAMNDLWHKSKEPDLDKRVENLKRFCREIYKNEFWRKRINCVSDLRYNLSRIIADLQKRKEDEEPKIKEWQPPALEQTPEGVRHALDEMRRNLIAQKILS